MTNVIAPRVRAVENMVARAQAVTQQRSTQGACLTCRAKLWISFFFDGTGNHKAMHFPKKHSNVAALVDAHLDEREAGTAAFYYEGIGTPFEFKDRYESRTVHTRAGAHKVETRGHREGASGWNMAFGTEIDKRLEKAIFDFQVFVDDWRRRRRVDEINLAAFGFSRGAATARAFMHWLANHSKVSASGASLKYDGIPLNVKFLGVFDTVESVGDAGENEQPELIKTSVPAFVEKALHVIAAHELRQAFPITVLGTNRYRQVVYPGAHADIGGGYSDGEQGRKNALPRIALLQMLDEARAAGLKIQSVGEMMQDDIGWQTKYRQSFSVDKGCLDTFNAYMKNVRVPAGPLDKVLESHCKLYRDWIEAGLAIEDVRENLAAARSANPRSERVEEALVQQHLLSNVARTPRGRGATIQGGPTRGAIPAAVEHLFENFVHDSFQHFSLSGGTVQKDFFSAADYYRNRTVLQPLA